MRFYEFLAICSDNTALINFLIEKQSLQMKLIVQNVIQKWSLQISLHWHIIVTKCIMIDVLWSNVIRRKRRRDGAILKLVLWLEHSLLVLEFRYK